MRCRQYKRFLLLYGNELSREMYNLCCDNDLQNKQRNREGESAIFLKVMVLKGVNKSFLYPSSPGDLIAHFVFSASERCGYTQTHMFCVVGLWTGFLAIIKRGKQSDEDLLDAHVSRSCFELCFLLLLLLFHFLLNHLFIQGHQWPQGGKKPHSFVKLTLVYLFPHLSSAFLHHPSLGLLG